MKYNLTIEYPEENFQHDLSLDNWQQILIAIYYLSFFIVPAKYSTWQHPKLNIIERKMIISVIEI